MAKFKSKCLICDKEFDNSHVQRRQYCSVGCQFSVVEYERRLSECHAYGLCASGQPYEFPCNNCPQKDKTND